MFDTYHECICLFVCLCTGLSRAGAARADLNFETVHALELNTPHVIALDDEGEITMVVTLIVSSFANTY